MLFKMTKRSVVGARLACVQHVGGGDLKFQ